MTAGHALLEAPVYGGYLYAYPHKSAYRPLAPPVPLRELWRDEDRSALFLYVHLPFCEMRCGFCNLFTTTRPGDDMVAAYLGALARQAEQLRTALGDDARFARIAIGGGTPTWLDAAQLERLFDLLEGTMGARSEVLSTSVECSPATASEDRLQVLRARGIHRISIGVQSFSLDECRAAGRPQQAAQVRAALTAIKQQGFPVLNIDLIYGMAGQSDASFVASIREALRWEPEELFLYPLYVRPLTGLDRQGRSWDDDRRARYRAGRDYLLSHGYEQVTMRLFRARHAPVRTAPDYCCQSDGMVGLGAGARSYTRGLHYSTEYAVRRAPVREIIASYIQRDAACDARAEYGMRLSVQDQQRRFTIMTLLHAGLPLADFAQRFGVSAYEAIPELTELPALGLATEAEGLLRLTPDGVERSDAIGPWLISQTVRQRMGDFELR